MAIGLQKVVWAEGVFLAQQHFQQWDACMLKEHHLRGEIYAPFGWGFSLLELDTDALKQGLFRVKECSGIFPNGQLFHFNMLDQDSLTYHLAKNKTEQFTLYLCMPREQSVAGIAGYQQQSDISGWKTEYIQICDQHDSNREREVMMAKANLTLHLEDENLNSYINLKIAIINRVGVDQYVFDEKFIPTLLKIGSSYALKNCLRRIIEITEAKMRVLRERRNEFGGSVVDFGHSDLAQFLLLETLSTALPKLRHCYQQLKLSPEYLYNILIEISGQLTAFSLEHTPDNLPAYRHGDLTATFNELEQSIFQLYGVVMPSKVAILKLQRESDSFYSIDSIDSTLLQQHSFFIAVYMLADDTHWINRFTQYVKVGSRKQIEMIVASALPGITLTHVQRTPSKLAIKSGYEYFRLEKYGQFWTDVTHDRDLSIFVSQEFMHAKIDVVNVQE